MNDIRVTAEPTPNPQSMKFIASRSISPEAVNFPTVTEAARSPLALKIFGFPWSAGVYLGPDFVTITKQDWVDWDILAQPLCDLIAEHLNRGEPVLVAPVTPVAAPVEDDPNDSPVVRHIKQILRDEIRPAVAMDGGDITFSRYEDGRVYLEMHGACSGCPSSTYTLKEGVETRLRQAIPEIQEVVSV